jgi:hypothetical protein
MLNLGSRFSYFINISLCIGEVHNWIDIYIEFSKMRFCALCRTDLDYIAASIYGEREGPTLINTCYKHQGIQTDDKCHDNLRLLMEVIIHYKNTINNTVKPPTDTRFLMSYNI